MTFARTGLIFPKSPLDFMMRYSLMAVLISGVSSTTIATEPGLIAILTPFKSTDSLPRIKIDTCSMKSFKIGKETLFKLF